MKGNYRKIGGVKYKVVQVKGLAREHGLMGQILNDELIIKIDADLPADRQEETFIHEMLHGVFFEAGYTEQDEDMINRVGKVLYQVIQDNLCSSKMPIDYNVNVKSDTSDIDVEKVVREAKKQLDRYRDGML
ncbi:ImmA/IrrE family metallo-endopeptidase [Bacillus sp. SH5-2]|uniref:ImmA/IrrE family metallo-endopeptidase n=1 Tax=Bacillus sp. SH5-2 TaxID=2217834 RepID=UPI0015D3B386|nr:ImmA/IrrE family metallo-endopeptidase [Bacillus sp. SH5-2]